MIWFLKFCRVGVNVTLETKTWFARSMVRPKCGLNPPPGVNLSLGLKCYGSTAVSKTARGGSIPSSPE